ncbi:MAG: ATP-grasp domain-containing protein [Bacteroidota bacterium]
MRLIFCDDGFSRSQVDYMFSEEFEAAKSHQIEISLISFEDLKRGDFLSAFKKVTPPENQEIGVYRGWMLKPESYSKFYLRLLDRNIRLINSPEEYLFCHYLPNSYDTISELTPKTVFKKLESEFLIQDLKGDLKVFGDKPIIVKDYVKSQKHYWTEACFIPNASDLRLVETVTNRFLELQDEDLNEGLVYREFIELEKLTEHSISGMPLTKEFRFFILDGKILSRFNYWDEGDYGETQPDLSRIETIIPKIKSNFFTMDVAKVKDGDWIIVELGDGQVSGLPENANKLDFYKALIGSLNN